MNLPLTPERVRPAPRIVSIVDAIRAIDPPQPATLRAKCPWCNQPLDGHVFSSFLDGKLLSISQTKRIGNGDYTWSHSKESCRVPKLDRISPNPA